MLRSVASSSSSSSSSTGGSGLQVVANRGVMPSATQIGNNSANQFYRADTRVRCISPAVAISRLCVAHAGFIYGVGAHDTVLGNDYGIETVLELSSPVAQKNLFYGGQQFGVVPNGVPFIISDPQDNQYIPADTVFYIRDSKIINKSSDLFPALYGTWANTGIGDYQAFDSNAASQCAATGTMSAPSSSTAFTNGVPYMILGVPASAQPAIGIVGDSIGWGQNDVADASGNLGYICRGLEGVNGHQMPYVNNSVGSNQYALAVINQSKRYRDSLRYVTHAVVELGTNDITVNSSNLAALQTFATNMANDLKSIIGPYGRRLQVAFTTLPPKTTSTDSWATLANQTPRTGFAAGGTRDTYNSWLKTQVGTLIDAVIDPNPYIEDPSGNVWIVTGAANYATSDGTHPSTAACILMAQAVNTWAASLST